MHLYKFYADWCQPCKVLSLILKQLEKELNSLGIIVREINIETNKELVERFKIVAVPTLCFEDGRKLVGLQSKEKIKEFLGV